MAGRSHHIQIPSFDLEDSDSDSSNDGADASAASTLPSSSAGGSTPQCCVRNMHVHHYFYATISHMDSRVVLRPANTLACTSAHNACSGVLLHETKRLHSQHQVRNAKTMLCRARMLHSPGPRGKRKSIQRMLRFWVQTQL